MSRLALIGLALAIVVAGTGNKAWAQRDAGAKIRGDYRSFWDPAFKTNPGRVVASPRTTPPGTSYRSFSYEPGVLSGRPGIDAIQRVPVQQLRTPASAGRGYRNFSYTPQVNQRLSGMGPATKRVSPWMYPKSDPRRYGPY